MYRMVMTPGGILGVTVDRPGSLFPRPQVRPLRWGEFGPVREVFAGLSARSRRMRFLASVPYMHPAVLHRLTAVDHDRHGCWVASVEGEPVGLGRYIRSVADPAVAEVAFEVADAFQGQGLGRLLLEVVGAAARDTGITSLFWLMDEENVPVQRLAASLGGTFTAEYGTLEGTTPLPVVAAADAEKIAVCSRLARVTAERAAAA
jgi:GNAT superfamily N-acetyltransferase